ncbi:MAG: hypothetical protein M3N47_07845 [Chloroflexota bacterium]|nr:hypothetical protein [Chloroflexota bacterium]
MVANNGGTTSGSAPTGWKLGLSEDFDGSSVDLTKWFIYGPNCPGNLRTGLRDHRRVSVGNGLLTLTPQMLNGTLVSGAISTNVYQAYGRWEFPGAHGSRSVGSDHRSSPHLAEDEQLAGRWREQHLRDVVAPVAYTVLELHSLRCRQ